MGVASSQTTVSRADLVAPLGYRPALDGIRAFAVLAVLGFHAGTMLGFHPEALKGGFIGLDIFFVLSGFLISTLLLEEWVESGSVARLAFYRRRARRLLPALGLAVALVGLIYLLRPGIDRGAGFGWSALAAISYSANFTHADLGLFTHTWSLALEEQFYILWPPVLLLCLRRRWPPQHTLALALVLATGFAVSRAALWAGERDGFSLNWRGDGLLFGCALALARSAPVMRRFVDRLGVRTSVALSAVAVLLVFASEVAPDDSVNFFGGLSLVAVAAGVVIVHAATAARSPLTELLTWQPLVWIGRRSYGIYLLHLPLFAAIKSFAWGVWPTTFVAVVVTLIAAAASFRWIESPFLRRQPRAHPQSGTHTLAPRVR